MTHADRIALIDAIIYCPFNPAAIPEIPESFKLDTSLRAVILRDMQNSLKASEAT